MRSHSGASELRSIFPLSDASKGGHNINQLCSCEEREMVHTLGGTRGFPRKFTKHLYAEVLHRDRNRGVVCNTKNKNSCGPPPAARVRAACRSSGRAAVFQAHTQRANTHGMRAGVPRDFVSLVCWRLMVDSSGSLPSPTGRCGPGLRSTHVQGASRAMAYILEQTSRHSLDVLLITRFGSSSARRYNIVCVGVPVKHVAVLERPRCRLCSCRIAGVHSGGAAVVSRSTELART